MTTLSYWQTGEITSRRDFPQLLEWKGLTKSAVEIGTHRGFFAARFLSQWPGVLHCIDPWESTEEYAYQEQFLPDKAETREFDYYEAKMVLARFGSRAVLLKTTSTKALQFFQNDQLDFVYVDGDHSEKAVLEDLLTWYPKVRSGGIIAGHDIVMPNESGGLWAPGIQRAVNEFARFHNLTVYLVVEKDNSPWSYYFIKP